MCLVETTVASRAIQLSSSGQSPPVAMAYLGEKTIFYVMNIQSKQRRHRLADYIYFLLLFKRLVTIGLCLVTYPSYVSDRIFCSN